ncbi:alpha/beta fold hydrolase [bacterium]|nr:alpha/beta fold hydrolase [bacterium]
MDDAFEIRGGRRGGVLLVHGFTGSPHEMAPLAAPLAGAGWDVVGVRLPGHGAAHAGESNDRTAWASTVHGAFAELLGVHGPGRVVVAGLSMGSLLALELALRERDRVAAVAALSPAIALPARRTAMLRGVGWMAPGGFRSIAIRKPPSDVRDTAAVAARPAAAPVTVGAALSFDLLRRDVRKLVRREGASFPRPLLVVHARRDRTCPMRGARWLARRMPGASPELHVLERSGHVIPIDLERDRAVAILLDFLERRGPRA